MRYSLTLFLVLAILSVQSQNIFYVKEQITGDGSGSSWSNASNDIQKMIDQAQKGDEIWVAKGTYYPTKTINTNELRSSSFFIKEGVDIYGGFEGIEPSRDQRLRDDLNENGIVENWEFKNQTILSGDLSGNDNYENIADKTLFEDNLICIAVQNEPFTTETIWDGITLQGGYLNVSGTTLKTAGISMDKNFTLKNSIVKWNQVTVRYCSGGGIYNNIGAIDNCSICNNSTNEEYIPGGGIYNNNGTVKNSTIQSNATYGVYSQGGGIYNNNGTIMNCVVDSNSTRTSQGGGIYSDKGEIHKSFVHNNSSNGFQSNGGGICALGTIVNESVIQNNSSEAEAGGIWIDLKGELTNSIIANNTAGGVFAYGESLISNSKISFNKGLGANLFRAKLENCNVFANSGSGAGGIYAYESTIINSNIFNNDANDGYNSGGGVSLNSGTIANCNILRNTSTDNKQDNCAAIIGEGTLINSVIWGNSLTTDQSKLYGTKENCAIMNGDRITDGVNGNILLEYDNTGKRTAHYPCFINPTSFIGLPVTKEDSLELENVNWGVSSQSALIDAGKIDIIGLNLPDSCINGNQRIFNVIDIGANEFIPSVITHTIEVEKSDSIVLSGEITTALSDNLLQYGFVLSDNGQFSVETDSIFPQNASDASWRGKYTQLLTSLIPFQTYFYRSFAITSVLDTLWGETKHFYASNKLSPNNGIIYVMESPLGKRDGSNWENATADLQGAIDASSSSDKVWVAYGTYKPNYTNQSSIDRNQYFIPKDGVIVLGGFSGTEKSSDDRVKQDLDQNGIIDPWEYKNTTILSGDIDSIKDDYSIWPATIDSSMAGNAYHVIYQTAMFDTLTVWDGFSIYGGNSNNDDHTTGGGIVALDSFKLMNCEIKFNHSYSSGALNVKKATVEKCKISFNKSNNLGGGVYAEESSLTDCLIENNNSINQSGGIMASNSYLINCFIHNNSAYENGGGSFNNSILENCSIANNKATDNVGGIILLGSTINNSKIFENENFQRTAGILVDENSTMKNCDVYLNKAKGLSFTGAGVQNLGTVLNCRIFGNKTESLSTDAAGIWNGGILMNSVVFNNEANGSIQCFAGGVYNRGKMINNTICNNKASLGAGNLNVSSSIVKNCVVWGKDELSDAIHFSCDGNLFSEIKSCAIMDGNQIATGINGTILLNSSNSGNEESNYPYFINPTTFAGYPQTPEDSIKMFEADWNISRKSALINKGYMDNLESLPDTCINGNKRILATIDIGAYEFLLAISTNDPTLINASGATMNGTVLTADSSNIAAYGFKYSEKKNFNPDTEGLEVLCNQLSTKMFSANLDGLKKFIPYYYVAFLKDTLGVYEYGDPKSFFTKNELKSRAGIFYVKQKFSGSGDGSSWENATGNLTEAISVSNPDNEIWIAEGIYRPNDLTPENTSNEQFFELKNGVSYYGGFEGNETSIDNRKKADNDQNGIIEAWEYSAQSILSADIDGIEDNYSNWPTEGTETTKNNAIHVLYQNYGTSGETLVDGLILQGATSGGVTIRSSTSLTNCIVRRNTNNTPLTNGGGVDNNRGKVISCLIDNNHITSPNNNLDIVSPGIMTGGGIINNYGITSNCKITNCSVAGYGVQGGGIQNWYGVVDHCEVANNVSTGNGGGIATYWGCVINSKIYNNLSKNAALWAERNDTLINCVVFNNTASSGVGGAEGWGFTHNLTSVNNIGNSSTIKDSGLEFYIENNCISTGNLNMSFPDDKQPIASSKDFKNPTTFVGIAQTEEERIQFEKADWSLIASSSYVNKGNNSLVITSLISDIDGNKRIYGDKIDLGAYEFQGTASDNSFENLSLKDDFNVLYTNNPSTIKISLGCNKPGKIIISDLSGRVVFRSHKILEDNSTINTSQLLSGVYIVGLVGNKNLSKYRKISVH